MSPRSWPLALAVALVASWALAGTAAAQTVEVDVLSPAHLNKQDGSVRVRVAYRCDPWGQVQEAHVSLSQDDQRIWGMSGLGGITCDGRWHRTTTIVRSFDGAFHKGEAYASAFLLLYDPNTGETRQGQAVETVLVR